MVLIFIVTLIIFIFVRSLERNNDFLRTEPSRQKNSLKTNAWLEHDLFQKFLAEKQYTTINELSAAVKEAHLKAQEEVSKRYFLPCIPLDAYKITCRDIPNPELWHVYVENLDDCDSFYVRSRRARLNKRFKNCDDSVLYDKFEPYKMAVSPREYSTELKRCIAAYKIRHKIGDYITCIYGLYKVIDITYNYNETKAYYALEAIEQNNPFKKITISVNDQTGSANHRVLV